jgi:hypothetical protein
MNLQRFPLLLAACASLVAAQSQPAVTAPPPPGVEEALRERVRPFFQAYVDGKFRKAYDIVADDSKDAYLTANKPHYNGFEILKIVFSDDYTKAAVTTEIHSTFTLFTLSAPEKGTVESSWKSVDGQWYWYIPPSEPDPFTPAQRAIMKRLNMSFPGRGPAPGAAPPGVSAALPPGMTPGMPSGLPPGFPNGTLPGGSSAAARDLVRKLRSQVKLDKDTVELRADQPGKAVVMVKNTMLGPAQIVVTAASTPGLAVTSDKTELAADESATITIAWTPVGPHVVPPPASCGVWVRPTGAFLPFTVTFR